jgi:hypothetical protein
MWCWTKTEVRWTDRVRNEGVLHRVKGDRYTLHAINPLKTKRICFI